MEVPAELEAKCDEAISHYPVSKRSAVLPLLHLMQHEHGYITDEAIGWVAEKLELEPIQVLEVVTFYPGFRLEAAGRHHIRVCRTLSCAMAGSAETMEKICAVAGIDRSGVSHHHPIAKSADGGFSVEFAECLASCGTGPVCMVGDAFFEKVVPEEVEGLLERFK